MVKEEAQENRRFLRRTKEDWVVDIFSYSFLIFVFIIMIYPFLNVLAISFNDPVDSIRGGITIWPRIWNVNTYKKLLGDKDLITATITTIARTVLGTVCSLGFTIVCAYLLSRRDFVLTKFMSYMLTFTMYFSAGLIPVYLLIRDMHLIGNFFVYIIPGLFSMFNIIITRTFMDGVPASLNESARLDGASEIQILTKIIMPLIIPVMAVVVLFVAIGNWNDWFSTFLYGNGKKSMNTLSYLLKQKLDTATMSIAAGSSAEMAKDAADDLRAGSVITPKSIKAAMTVIVTVPIILLYPILQRYFITGMTIGGVKE